MLNINKEFRKGILFVRLDGILDRNSVTKLDEEVTSLVKDMEIRNVVFNISNLKSIDIYGINSLLSNYKLCQNNSGVSLLCGVNNTLVKHRIHNSRIHKYMYETTDEISAINYINI